MEFFVVRYIFVWILNKNWDVNVPRWHFSTCYIFVLILRALKPDWDDKVPRSRFSPRYIFVWMLRALKPQTLLA